MPSRSSDRPGPGKSTLLYIIGGLDAPTAGTVLVGGRNPYQLGPAEQAAFRNQQVGFVFQDHHLLPQCTVLENVSLPTLAGNGATPELVKRAEELLGEIVAPPTRPQACATFRRGATTRGGLSGADSAAPVVVGR